MYFLENMCRICVQTGAPLIDINTVDFDSVKLSEKLEICAKMVADSGGVYVFKDAISKDHISSDICEKCVNKLRVSYHFLEMCKKSTKIIQGYLQTLIGPENVKECTSFKNSELNAIVEKLPDAKLECLEDEEHTDHNNENRNMSEYRSRILHFYNDTEHRIRPCRKRQRITKEQRCSLLKRLLNRPKRERDKPVSVQTDHSFDYEKGGLKNIIDFAKNYEFSFKLDKNSNIESTPLDKLTAFSTNYFTRDFTEFKNHILYIIENRDRIEDCTSYSTDDDEYISESDMEDEGEEGEGMEFEEVMVEPDIKIKSEVLECDEDESQCPLDYLETSFEEEDIKIKKEDRQSDSENEPSHHKLNHPPITHLSNFYHNLHIKEEDSLPNNFTSTSIDTFSTIQTNYKSSLGLNSSPAVKLLDKLVSTYPMGSRKVFSASNVRCRTRDQPYINPQLKDQFLYRSFRCERCNRYFKSQGYLKAHTSKVH